MRTVILGAGGLGGVLGGMLAAAGADVTLVARPAQTRALRRHGLTLVGATERHGIRVPITADAGGVRAADLFILAVKTYDTAAALAAVAHLRGHVRIALSFQNGLLKDEALAGAFGPDVVCGAVTMVGGIRERPTRFRYTLPGVTYVGELDGRISGRVEAVAALLTKGGFTVEATPHARAATWAKLNQMVPAATLSCLTRLAYYRLCTTERLARLFVTISRECALVGEALGYPLMDFPGFEVRTLAALPFDDAVAFLRARGSRLEAQGLTRVRISTLQDLDRGRRTELPDVVGPVLAAAAREKVPVPALATLAEVLLGLEESGGEIAPGPRG
jgi:2-dehydropantoate 2-reductase